MRQNATITMLLEYARDKLLQAGIVLPVCIGTLCADRATPGSRMFTHAPQAIAVLCGQAYAIRL